MKSPIIDRCPRFDSSAFRIADETYVCIVGRTKRTWTIRLDLLRIYTERAGAFAVERMFKGGRTAKATDALGDLPYAALMPYLVTRFRFTENVSF